MPTFLNTFSWINILCINSNFSHYDVIKWKIFHVTGLLCREFTGHRWIPPHKGQWHRALMFSLICTLNKWLSKQSWGWWFEKPSCSLWHHCNMKFVLKCFVLKCPVNNKSTLVLLMGCHWWDAMRVTNHFQNWWWSSVLPHLCITWPKMN